MRAVSTNPNTLDAVVDELDSALGRNRRYDMFVASVKHDIKALKAAPATKAAAAAREKGLAVSWNVWRLRCRRP